MSLCIFYWDQTIHREREVRVLKTEQWWDVLRLPEPLLAGGLGTHSDDKSLGSEVR